jgi:LysR family transcriptional regulator, pca operon transcriptional activator
LDITKLRHLAAVIRHGSFSDAAEALGISQPALSKVVRCLERELGVTLLERGRFGAVPTESGLALARHADAVEAELRSAQAEIAGLRAGIRGRIRIGCGPSEATRLLPKALARLKSTAPETTVTVLYGLNEALVPMVLHGEVDFALASIPDRELEGDLRRIPLYRDSAAVVARSGHPLLAKPGPLTARQLLDQNWILARRRELERRALDDLFIGAGLEPVEAVIETTSAVLMKTLVIQSDFLTFLPRDLIYWEERSGQLRALDILAPSWRRLVGVTLRARGSITPAAEAAIAVLRKVAEEFL